MTEYEMRENSQDEFKGLEAAWDNVALDFVSPKTKYVPQSSEQLAASEQARLASIQKLKIGNVVAAFVNISGKQLSEADVVLLCELFSAVERYEESV